MYSFKMTDMKNSKSSWGEARANSGQKHKWKTGETKAVRIPLAILDEVLMFARLLDEQDSSLKVLSCDLSDSFESVHKYKKIKILVSAWSLKANQTSNPKWNLSFVKFANKISSR